MQTAIERNNDRLAGENYKSSGRRGSEGCSPETVTGPLPLGDGRVGVEAERRGDTP